MPTGMSELNWLLQNLQPYLNLGEYSVCSLGDNDIVPPEAIFWFREREGITVIIPSSQAVKIKSDMIFQAEWITLEVHSDLSAVGLTAAVSAALANAGISCNIVAGYHHDHLFVPAGRGQEAVNLLLELQRQHTAG